MRVLFVNRFYFPDGSATSQLLTDLATQLVIRGWDVEVITSCLVHNDVSVRLPSFAAEKGVMVHRVATSRFGRSKLLGRAVDYLTFYLSASLKLFARASSDSIIVVLTDPPLISVACAVVAKMKNAALINWLQDLFPEVAGALGMRVAQGVPLKSLRCLRNWGLRRARFNVVIGARMAKLLGDNRIPADRTKLIHNWADGESIRPEPSSSTPLRSAWNLQGKFVVGYSGNLGRAHEFDTILDAAAKLRSNDDIVFLLIGSGAQLKRVEQETKRRKLHNIKFRPFQPRELLSASLGVSDVHLVTLNPALEGLVVPSKFYGIAAAGKATINIGDPSGEIAEIVNSFKCGYSVSIADYDRLAQRILELAQNPDLCRQLGANARAAFDEHFGFEIAATKWVATLTTIARTH